MVSFQPLRTISLHLGAIAHHNHGRLKSTVPESGRGLPKMETGTTSSTQMAVTSSRAGKRLVPWQFKSAFDFDWSRVFFSWRARNFCNCCSCLILCASHLFLCFSSFSCL